MDTEYLNSKLSTLSTESRQLLSSRLNTIKVIQVVCPDQQTRSRDWRGLASLVNISSEEAAFLDASQCDKTCEVLNIWIKKSKDGANVSQLLEYLMWLDRYDVCDDIQDLAKENKLIVRQAQANQIVWFNRTDEDIITYQDNQRGEPQYYDAYLLYAPNDETFAKDMLQRLQDRGLRLCTETDILPGHPTDLEPVSRLISERCSHVIVILSPDFNDSRAGNFFASFAHADGIKKKQRKIIPVEYRPCMPPPALAYFHKLRYPQAGEKQAFDFWQKLSDAVAPAHALRSSSSTHSTLKISEISRTVSNVDIPAKTTYLEKPCLALPGITTSVPSDLNVCNTDFSMSLDSKSLSNTSELSEGKKKKTGKIRKIYKMLTGKKAKNVIAVAN